MFTGNFAISISVGDLKQARQGHGLMVNGKSEIFVVGGMDPESIDPLFTEKCSQSFECRSQGGVDRNLYLKVNLPKNRP